MQCIYKIFKTQEIGKSNNVDKLDKVLFFFMSDFIYLLFLENLVFSWTKR